MENQQLSEVTISTPPASEIPEVLPMIKVGDRIMSHKDLGLVSGYVIDTDVKTKTEKDLAPMRWKGSKIPVPLFRTIVAFFKWVNDTHHTEATARWFYHSVSGEWRVEVLHQKICGGLAAKELDDKTENVDLLGKMESDGFDTNGSIHSHCDASAFQSGVDSADEREDVGFHVTVGRLSSGRADLHCRYTLFGLVYKVVDEDWFDGDIEQYLSLADTESFPEEWKSRMHKVEARPVYKILPPGRQMPWTHARTSRNCFLSEGDSYGDIPETEFDLWGFNSRVYGSVSSPKCAQKYVAGRIESAHSLIEHVFEGVIRKMLSKPDVSLTSAKINGFVVEFLTLAVLAARVEYYLQDPSDANRLHWRRPFNKIITDIDNALDDFNPVYELLAGATMFPIDHKEALEAVFGHDVWAEDLDVLLDEGLFDADVFSGTVYEGLLSDGDLPFYLDLEKDGSISRNETKRKGGKSNAVGIIRD